MAVDRRRFLALLAALPFAGRLFEREDTVHVLEYFGPYDPKPIQITRTIARVELTEETQRKVEANKEAFLKWAENEVPRYMDEEARRFARMLDSIPEIEPVTGRFFETSSRQT